MNHPRFYYEEDRSAPFGFVLVDIHTNQRHNPVEVARTRDVEIVYDKAGKTFWMAGEDMPWWCPIKGDRAYNFAAMVGVRVTRLKWSLD